MCYDHAGMIYICIMLDSRTGKDDWERSDPVLREFMISFHIKKNKLKCQPRSSIVS